MNKKADINWELVALIIAVILLVVLLGIIYFSGGEYTKIFESIKKIVWFT